MKDSNTFNAVFANHLKVYVAQAHSNKKRLYHKISFMFCLATAVRQGRGFQVEKAVQKFDQAAPYYTSSNDVKFTI